MAAIRIFRPKRDWSVSPATVLPLGLLLRLFRRHWNLTVVIDGSAAGKIGVEQMKVFEVGPGTHGLYVRVVLLRRSKQFLFSLKEDEERKFLCGTNGIGWPTLREASAQDAAEMPGTAPGG